MTSATDLNTIIKWGPPPAIASARRPDVDPLRDSLRLRSNEWAEVHIAPREVSRVTSGAGGWTLGEWRITKRGGTQTKKQRELGEKIEPARVWVMHTPLDADGLNEAEREADCPSCSSKAGAACSLSRYHFGSDGRRVATHAPRWAKVAP